MQNADRIVGGVAAPSMIPWQVAIMGTNFCGGTIIDKCTILTARHCDIKIGDTIRAGSLNKQSGGQVITLKSYSYFSWAFQCICFYTPGSKYIPSHIKYRSSIQQ